MGRARRAFDAQSIINQQVQVSLTPAGALSLTHKSRLAAHGKPASYRGRWDDRFSVLSSRLSGFSLAFCQRPYIPHPPRRGMGRHPVPLRALRKRLGALSDTVLSWLIKRGKSRGCGGRISARYPVVELLNGALLYLCERAVGITPYLAPALALVTALLVAAFIDIGTQEIPNGVTVFILIVAVLWNAYAVFDDTASSSKRHRVLYGVGHSADSFNYQPRRRRRGRHQAYGRVRSAARLEEHAAHVGGRIHPRCACDGADIPPEEAQTRHTRPLRAVSRGGHGDFHALRGSHYRRLSARFPAIIRKRGVAFIAIACYSIIQPSRLEEAL